MEWNTSCSLWYVFRDLKNSSDEDGRPHLELKESTRKKKLKLWLLERTTISLQK